MNKPEEEMDQQEQKIQKLADDINPSQDVVPDSVAEATTVPLDYDVLGGNATQNDAKNNKDK